MEVGLCHSLPPIHNMMKWTLTHKEFVEQCGIVYKTAEQDVIVSK